MVTYRRNLERKYWHRPWPIRLVLVVMSLVLLLVGWVAWDLEQQKGGWEGSGLGHHMVEEDVVAGRVLVRDENNEIVFEGTSIDEADAWIESQRDRDFTVPTLLLAAGAVLFLVGVAPSPRKSDLNDEPQVRVRT